MWSQCYPLDANTGAPMYVTIALADGKEISVDVGVKLRYVEAYGYSPARYDVERVTADIYELLDQEQLDQLAEEATNEMETTDV